MRKNGWGSVRGVIIGRKESQLGEGHAPPRLRTWPLGDCGRVSLSTRKNAKGGEQGTQLACGSNKCPLSSNAFSRELRGNQLPKSRRGRGRRRGGTVG